MQTSVSDSEIIKDIRRVASDLGVSDLSRSQYLQRGNFSIYQIYDGGRTWGQLCSAAGLGTKAKKYVPDDVYFSKLQEAVEQLGRYPKTSERKRFGLNFSKLRYPSLQIFIEEAVRRGVIKPPKEAQPQESPVTQRNPDHLGAMVVLPSSTPMEASQIRQVPPIPRRTSRIRWERTGLEGFPYAPQDESGVVALFGILCNVGHIRWQILELKGGRGIDATCYDEENRQEINVELKHTLSRGGWNHAVEDIDYVVCWENRWPDFPKPVVELKELVERLSTAK